MYELMQKQFQQLDNKKKKKKRGFTLIELIIVIAILAILAAILVPLMIGWINEARTATANANARTVYSAATATAASLLAQTPAQIPTASTTIASDDTELTDADLAFRTQMGVLLGADFTTTDNAVWEVTFDANSVPTSTTFTNDTLGTIVGEYPVTP